MNRFATIDHAEAVLRASTQAGAHLIKDLAGPVIERAHAVDPAGTGSLGDIEHFVFLGIIHALDILTSNPAVWEKTALIISYDENGGLFAHVPPPVPPPGTPGEYVTAPLAGLQGAQGIAGPVGLGFRVPCLVISPYTRGGLVASEVFDHTSQLRPAERRFGVPVPHLSDWRRATVGDLTSAFDFADPAQDARAQLPRPDLGGLRALIEGNSNILLGFREKAAPHPVPPNLMPVQETTPVRRRPRGLG